MAATLSMTASLACGWGNESQCKPDEWKARHIPADTRSIPLQTRSIPLQSRSSDCSLFAPEQFRNHCYSNSRCKRKTEHGVTLIAPNWSGNTKSYNQRKMVFFYMFPLIIALRRENGFFQNSDIICNFAKSSTFNFFVIQTTTYCLTLR